MPDILRPLPFLDLETKPPLTGRVRITDEMQQTLALLSGWDGASRRLLNVSPSGVLHVCSSTIKGILNEQALAAVTDYQLPDIKTSEVLIRAKPTNSGRIWVNLDVDAGDNIGYPLDSGEWINFSVDNLHRIHWYSTVISEWMIVLYTK